ncbi:hypothetical protein GCK32_013284 [Trichostrongylus colubriformis]|uniref:Uncharacterized protein n=1 Tax=Trichostrongylus colubriformis TaxID=6319 RepID=A0AAN8F859_TRICO
MWYPKDKEQNCLLNSETKKTRPSLFIPEDTGHMMVYFEHPDAVFMRRLRDDLSSEKTEISKPDEHWTAWSTCHGNKEKARYQKCTEHSDVRKCQKESAPCSGTAHAQQGDKQ